MKREDKRSTDRPAISATHCENSSPIGYCGGQRAPEQPQANRGRSTTPLLHCAIAAASVVPALATAAEPSAQDVAASADGDDGVVEEVLVTGSHIRASVDSSSPIVAVDAAQILDTPRANLTDFFFTLPQNAGSFVIGNARQQGSGRFSNIDLRGLGPRGTLVLLNGRRTIEFALDNREGLRGVDVNALIPRIALQRVDLLLDGSAALYGTDAVAGVANFITRRNFEGAEVSVDLNRYSRVSSADGYVLQGIFGAGAERSHATFSIEYNKQASVFNNELFSPQTLRDYGLSNNQSFPGTFRGVNAQGVPTGPFLADPSCGSTQIAGGAPESAGFLVPQATGGAQCFGHNLVDQNIIAGTERINAFAEGYHELSDRAEVWAELGLSRARNSSVADAFPFQGIPGGGFLVPQSNPGNTFGRDVRWVAGRMAPNDYRVPLENSSDVWRIAAGSDLELGTRHDWRLRVSGVYALNEALGTQRDAVVSRVNNALNGLGGDLCDPIRNPGDGPGRGNCYYFNPFGNAVTAAPGSARYNTQAVYDYVLAERYNQGKAEFWSTEAVIDGKLFDLPAGPLGIAAGLQYRFDEIDSDADPLTNAGERAFNRINFDYGGEQSVRAVFVESLVPIVQDLEVQLAARYEHYGHADSLDPKIGALWRPTSTLTIRASWGTSFRAPGIAQSRPIQQANVLSFASPGTPGFAGSAGAVNPLGITTGNPDVQPEESASLSTGFDWELTDDVSFGLTYWHIKFDNIVAAPGPTEFLAERGPAVLLDPSVFKLDANGRPIEFYSTFLNRALLETDGIDLRAEFRFDAGAVGQLVLKPAAAWVSTYDVRATRDAPTTDGVGSRNDSNFGVPMAEWRANAALTWLRGQHRATLTARYISGLQDDRTSTVSAYTGLRLRQDDSSFTTFDLLYSFTDGLFGLQDSELGCYVTNMLDESPPLLDQAPYYWDLNTYDGRGRIYGVQARLKF
jgi:iron complex outermembrane recepter protein